ncbi:unnamed protein product [Heligmosomoides polygyrus]|uniref:DUF4226 domain-containing protein n=1 Tax=Heligmosomoides polygyrus TaxID=6339 RepID=A0A183G7A2_HELPZ|nr:unnamed protein product [Heligmosomoides polygyrus]
MDSGEDLYAPPENHSTEQPFAASGQSIRSNSADVVNEALPLSALRSSSDSSFHGINEKVCDQPLAALEQSMRPADTVAIPIEETPSTSAAEFNKLADEVRAATDSAEKVLEDYTAEADQLQKAKEKLESQEPTLSKLSDMATAMAQSGDTDGIDVVSSLAQQFEGVRCAIEDRIDDVAHEQPAEEEASTTSDAEFNRLVDEVRAATDAAESVLFEGTSDVDRLQKTREALESHEPAWTKLTDLAMVRVHSGDTDGYDVVSSLSEQYEAVRFAIVDRIDELRSEVRF